VRLEQVTRQPTRWATAQSVKEPLLKGYRSCGLWPGPQIVESKSMAFGSDDILYTSVGKVHYRLDKNWKRQDWWYQRGIQRGLGQAPCDPENVDTE
jgi:hypothetical protein